MTASATAVSSAACFPEYNEETDTQGETVTTIPDHNVVIKLEPESDVEDLSQSSIQASTTSSVQDNEETSSQSQQLNQWTTENGLSPTNYELPDQIKKEENTSMAVFPVRAFRNDHGNAREDKHLLQHDTSFEPSQYDEASDGDDSMSSGKDSASRGRGHSSGRRRKLSVSRKLPVLCLTPRTKRKKTARTENGQADGQVPGTLGESDRQMMAMEGVYGSVFPGHSLDKPPVRSSKRGRRRTNKPPNLVCGICGMTFRWPSRYNEHLRKHSGERPHICRECGDAFTSSSYLRIHARKHSGLLPYPCVICGEAFHQAHLLTEHRRRHAQEGAFTCEDCGLQCWSPNELSKHIQTLHPENPSNKPFVCQICPAAFQRSYHLETHMRTHTGEKPFKCDLCGLAYTTQGSLKVHMRTHTGERPFACTECDRAFITSGQLKKHSRTHNRPIVTMSSDSNTVYVQKLKSVTTPVKEEDKKEGTDLKLEIQCFPKDSTYSCDICSEVFVRSIDLASHMRHDHPQPVQKGKENMCRECGQVFSRPHTLKVHLRSHAGIRPFKCETCGKQFTQRSYLNFHLRSHSRDKPFKCTVCGTSYSSAKYREIHMKSHGEIRPNECIVCGSTFSSNTVLTNHVKSHDHSEVIAAIAVSSAVRETFKSALGPAPNSEVAENQGLSQGNTDPVCEEADMDVQCEDGGDALGNQGDGEHSSAKVNLPSKKAKPSVKRKKEGANTKNNLPTKKAKQSVKRKKEANTKNSSADGILAVTDSDKAFKGDCYTNRQSEIPESSETDCKAVTEFSNKSEDMRESECEDKRQETSDKNHGDQSDNHYSSDTETEYD